MTRYFSRPLFPPRLASLMSIPMVRHGTVDVSNVDTGDGPGRLFSSQVEHRTCSIAALEAGGTPFSLNSLASDAGGL